VLHDLAAVAPSAHYVTEQFENPAAGTFYFCNTFFKQGI
jgi:hypothetical protein